MSLKTHQQEQIILLFSENNDINGSLLKLQLDQYCQHVVLAKEKNETLMLIKTTLFDLILLALNVNDFGLINQLKAADCINNKTPVIAIIDSAINTRKKSIIAAGFDDYLVIPFAVDQLKEFIDFWQIENKTTTAFGYIQSILNITKNNRHLTATIFKKLFEELPLQIICIKDALANQQYTLAEEITHKLHGSVSFCGLVAIQKPANLLENRLRNKDYLAITQDFLVLQQCVLDFTSQQKTIVAFFTKDISQ
jgi:CheY-like chemotaxis protein